MSNYNGGSIDAILDRMWSSNLYEYDKDRDYDVEIIAPIVDEADEDTDDLELYPE